MHTQRAPLGAGRRARAQSNKETYTKEVIRTHAGICTIKQ